MVLLTGRRNRQQAAGPREHATPKDWQKHICSVGNRVFRNMYRLDVMSFHKLLNKQLLMIEPCEVEMAVRSAGSEVRTELRLAMTLRYLTGGIIWDSHDNFGLSVGELYRSVFRTVDAVNHTIKADWDLNEIDRLKDIESGLGAKYRIGA